MENLIVKKLAEKHGLSEEEAKALFESLKEEDDFKTLLAEVSDIAAITSQLPESTQNALQPVIQTHLFNQIGGFADIKKSIERIGLYAAALRAIISEDPHGKYIEKLEEDIKTIKNKLEEKERGEIFKQFEIQLAEIKQFVEEKYAELMINQPVVETKDDLDKLEEILDKAERTKQKLERLGIVKPREDLDLNEAEQLLRQHGYEIRAPPSWQTVESLLDRKIREKEEKIRKEIEDEFKVDEKRLSMVLDFCGTIFEGIFDTITSERKKEGGKIDQFKKRVKELAEREE